MNTFPSAKDIALSLFCFWGNLCARSLLSGDLVIVRQTGSKGRDYIKGNRKALPCFETQKGELSVMLLVLGRLLVCCVHR